MEKYSTDKVAAFFRSTYCGVFFEMDRGSEEVVEELSALPFASDQALDAELDQILGVQNAR